MAGGEASAVDNDVVPTELPAPQGWKKMLTPKKGSTQRGNEIVFVSPTGEEIKSKRQLNQYLKSHDGGPSVSEFHWSTGESPRRSRRLSNKSKATEIPESERSQKRQNKSSSKKGDKDDIDGEDEAAEAKEDAAAGEETKPSEEIEVKDAEDGEDKSRGDVSIKEDYTAGAIEKDLEPKTNVKVDEMNILENQESADVTTSDTKKEQVANNSLPTSRKDERKEKAEKLPAEPEAATEMETQEADNKTTSDAKEQVGSESLPARGPEENNREVEKQQADYKAPSLLPVQDETASHEKEVEVVKEALPEADTKSDKESETAKAGKEASPDKEASTEKLASDGETKANDDLKENQDGPKPTDNRSVSSEETSYEPKASGISS